MTITRIAATRPGTSREDMARLNSLATDEFLCVAGAGLLLGVPGTLVGPFLRVSTGLTEYQFHQITGAPGASAFTDAWR